MHVEVVPRGRTMPPSDQFAVTMTCLAGVLLCAMGTCFFIYWENLKESGDAFPALPAQRSTRIIINDSSDAYDAPKVASTSTEGKCYGRHCFSTANFVVSKLNNTVGPCEDFYHFVCSAAWFDNNDTYKWPFRYKSLGYVYNAIHKYVEALTCPPNREKETDIEVDEKQGS
ncbi:neprilysin-21-like [Ornithodoros turicata]|uniref:neprilysin-21-like n=1 Tax=Ornithodoros turicata TaxID=34597 RepID=UPI00313A3D84